MRSKKLTEKRKGRREGWGRQHVGPDKASQRKRISLSPKEGLREEPRRGATRRTGNANMSAQIRPPRGNMLACRPKKGSPERDDKKKRSLLFRDLGPARVTANWNQFDHSGSHRWGKDVLGTGVAEKRNKRFKTTSGRRETRRRTNNTTTQRACLTRIVLRLLGKKVKIVHFSFDKKVKIVHFIFIGDNKATEKKKRKYEK